MRKESENGSLIFYRKLSLKNNLILNFNYYKNKHFKVFCKRATSKTKTRVHWLRITDYKGFQNKYEKRKEQKTSKRERNFFKNQE